MKLIVFEADAELGQNLPDALALDGFDMIPSESVLDAAEGDEACPASVAGGARASESAGRLHATRENAAALRRREDRADAVRDPNWSSPRCWGATGEYGESST